MPGRTDLFCFPCLPPTFTSCWVKTMSLGPDPAWCSDCGREVAEDAGAAGGLCPADGCADAGSGVTLASPAPQTPSPLLPGAGFGCIKAAAKQTLRVLASPGVSLLTLRLQCLMPLGPYKLRKPCFKPTISQRHVRGASYSLGLDQCPHLLCPPRGEQALPR